MLESLLAAFTYLGQDINLAYLLLGVAVGLVFGSIPGLGGATAIALLLPLTFGLEADQAIILMGGVMGAVSIGGSVSAILLNTPGTAPNAATCIDGYPLSQKGKAGLAIGAAATASSLGGIISLFILVLLLPVAKSIVLLFGPPAFFMLAVLGLTSLTVAGDNLLRGLIAACVGLFVGFVGYDDIGGTERYVAGIEFLWDGISIVPLLIGLFAIAEMLNLYRTGGPISSRDTSEVLRVVGTADGVRAVFRNPRTLFSGSAIGTVIGIVPGVGGTVASFLAYSFAAQTSRDNENFGKGDIRGVIAPEAANNAKDGGALIPTLAFGIPGSAEMAIFLGVLTLHGMDPGPMLLIEREATIIMLIIALLLATIVSGMLILAANRYLAKIAHIDSMLLIPCVIIVSLVGAYALHNSMGDVLVAALFGVLGYIMIRTGYPRITLVIAFVLSGLMERNFIQSMIMFDGDWTRLFNDKTAFVLFLLTLIALAVPLLKLFRKKTAANMTTKRQVPLVDVVIALILTVIAASVLISAYSYSRASGLFPVFTGWIFLLLSLLELALRSGALLREKKTAKHVDVSIASPTMLREAGGFLWLGAIVGMLYVVGFLVATPLFVFAFLWLAARRSMFQSLAFAVIATGFIYVVFAWLLRYHLYPGILFAGITT